MLRRVKWEYDPLRKVHQPKLQEEHVLREIVQRLWLAKIPVFRVNCSVGGKVRPNQPGIPDLIGYIPYKVWSKQLGEGQPENGVAIPLFIEVKRPGGARRTAQIQFINDSKSAGCAAFFAESWADVVAELGRIGVVLPS